MRVQVFPVATRELAEMEEYTTQVFKASVTYHQTIYQKVVSFYNSTHIKTWSVLPLTVPFTAWNITLIWVLFLDHSFSVFYSSSMPALQCFNHCSFWINFNNCTSSSPNPSFSFFKMFSYFHTIILPDIFSN